MLSKPGSAVARTAVTRTAVARTAVVLTLAATLTPSTPAEAAPSSGCSNVRGATSAQATAAETQLRLSMLGTRLTVDGDRGPRTIRATKAWEKRNKLPVDGKMSSGDLRLLRSQTSGGYSVRVDLDRQIIRVRRGSKTAEVRTSTGSGLYYGTPGNVQRAITPTGKFRIERRISGVRKSRLGCLVDPLYFLRGWAIHGGNARKPYQSHGCARVDMPVIAAFARVLPNGTSVIVSGTNPRPRNTPKTPVR